MKILYVGNHNPHFLNSNFFRRRAFEALGHQVVFFEDRDFLLPARISRLSPPLARWDLGRLNRRLLKTACAERPALCLVVGGGKVLPETLKFLRSQRIPIALLTTDPPGSYFAHIINTAPLYDFLFCSGTEAVDILKDHGISNTHWVPFACDPDYHHSVEIPAQERSDLSREAAFVGSYYPNREVTLEAIAHFNIGIWGPGWAQARSPILKTVTVDKRLDCAEWTKIFSAAKTVVVIHYNDEKTLCYQASPKLYEALACRKLVLVDRQKDVQTLFRDGTHLVFFDDSKDLAAKLSYYLSNDRDREQIAEQGYREVIAKHTYRHRAEQIIRIVGT